LKNVQPNMIILNNIFGANSHFAVLLVRYKFLVIAGGGFTALTCFALLIVNIINFSKSGSNVNKRSMASTGIMVTLGCMAVLGSFASIYTLIISFI